MAVHDLTIGPIRGHLLRMSAFMLIGMVVQILYSLIDLYWVGRLGKDAVAAVGVASNLQLAVMALTQILAVGVGALVAQAAGRKDHHEVRWYFNQSQLLALVLGFAFGVPVFAARAFYADRIAGDEATAALTRQFLFWFIPALVLQFPLTALASALRGIGDMRPGLVAQLLTVIFNILLAPFLIFGWGTHHPFGVAGASLATLIAITLGSCGLLLHVFRRGGCFDPHPRDWVPKLSLWSRTMRIGLPSGAEFALLALYMMFVMATIRPFGASAQAAFSIGSRLLQAGMMPVMAISFAAAAIAGQNFGARQAHRVRETFYVALKACMGVVGVFFVLFHLIPDTLFHLFARDATVVAVGEEYLRIISWNLLATGLVLACFGIFSGLGNTLPSLLGSATRISLIVVPVWLLSQRADFQLRWIWELSTSATVVQMALNVWLLRREFLKRLDFSEPAPVPVVVATSVPGNEPA
jgi:putative MATE family efflux protein